MFILTLGLANVCILLHPTSSSIIYRLHPEPWLLSPRPSNAARLSRPGMGIPGFWGGTKRVNITSGERFVSMFILVRASKQAFGKTGFARTWGKTLKASSKNEKQNKKSTPALQVNSPMETVPSQRMGMCCHLVLAKPKSGLVKSRGFSDGAETINAKF